MNSLTFSFFVLRVSSNTFDAFYVCYLILLKKLIKRCVSVSSIFSEQVRPSSLMVAISASLSISVCLTSSIYWTRPISRFFSISYHLFSRFFGLSIGIVKPAASATFTLLYTLGLMASWVGSISVSQIFRRHPSRVGRFFSQTLSCLFFSRSIIFLSFSVSLNEKMSSSDGKANGFSWSSPNTDYVADAAAACIWLLLD